jgi:diphthamide biosynthesis methyltransferase
MVLYIIGLGLGDEKDITVRGLETVHTAMYPLFQMDLYRIIFMIS